MSKLPIISESVSILENEDSTVRYNCVCGLFEVTEGDTILTTDGIYHTVDSCEWQPD